MGEVIRLRDEGQEERISAEVIPIESARPSRGVFICPKTGKETEIEVTERNIGFFYTPKNTDVPRVVKQGSFVVVSYLLSEREAQIHQQTQASGPPKAREMAFFDTSGTFHDRVRLFDVVLDEAKSEGIFNKHSAVFEYAKTSRPLYAQIDDIYCISPAVAEIPGKIS